MENWGQIERFIQNNLLSIKMGFQRNRRHAFNVFYKRPKRKQIETRPAYESTSSFSICSSVLPLVSGRNILMNTKPAAHIPA